MTRFIPNTKRGAGRAGSSGLKRRLSTFDVLLVAVGSMIGSAWFLAPQAAAQAAGPSVIITWVVGVVLVAFLAAVFAELGAMLPLAGGVFRYPRFSHGRPVGFLISCMGVAASSVTAAIEVVGLRTYAALWFPWVGAVNPTVAGWFVQFVLLIGFFCLNYWSVNVFGKVNSAVTTIKFLTPILAIILLFTQFQPKNLSIAGFAPDGVHGILSALIAGGVVFTFFGFQQALYFGSEAKNPGRSIPISVFGSLGAVFVLYVLLQLAYIGAMPAHDLAHGWQHVAIASPFATLLLVAGFTWAANWLFVDLMLSTGGTGSIIMGSTGRGIYSWAKNGSFFKTFAKVDRKSGIPRSSMILAFILSVLWTLPFPSWNKLIGVAANTAMFGMLILPVSLIVLRKTVPELPRPFRLKGAAVIAPVAFLIASMLIFWGGWDTNRWVIPINLVEFVIYVLVGVNKDRRAPWLTDLKAAYWLIAYSIVTLVWSWLGSFGGINAIPAPWDQIVFALISIATYVWGVRAGVHDTGIMTDDELSSDAADDASAEAA